MEPPNSVMTRLRQIIRQTVNNTLQPLVTQHYQTLNFMTRNSFIVQYVHNFLGVNAAYNTQNNIITAFDTSNTSDEMFDQLIIRNHLAHHSLAAMRRVFAMTYNNISQLSATYMGRGPNEHFNDFVSLDLNRPAQTKRLDIMIPIFDAHQVINVLNVLLADINQEIINFLAQQNTLDLRSIRMLLYQRPLHAVLNMTPHVLNTGMPVAASNIFYSMIDFLRNVDRFIDWLKDLLNVNDHDGIQTLDFNLDAIMQFQNRLSSSALWQMLNDMVMYHGQRKNMTFLVLQYTFGVRMPGIDGVQYR